MSFEFKDGTVIKVDSSYYSETNVSSDIGLITNRTAISSSSTEVCKTDVWIKIGEKDVCISLNTPFKALPQHKVTISYCNKTGKPIQLFNRDTGTTAWCSTEAQRAYGAVYGASVFEEKAVNILKETLKVALITFMPFIFLFSHFPLTIFFWVFFSILYFGYESSQRYTNGLKQAALLYAPLLIGMFLFDSQEWYVFTSLLVLIVAKSFEKQKLKVKESNTEKYELAKKTMLVN